MALSKSYLTSSKNLQAMFTAIQTAQAPDKFTVRFLENLEYKSSSDRLFISILKSLRFLTNDGSPTERYFRYLDQTLSEKVLAEGIREAYGDLFQVNRKAQTLSKAEVLNKIKTLSQGKLSDSVLDKMGMTFVELCKLADFSENTQTKELVEEDQTDISVPIDLIGEQPKTTAITSSLGGLHYNIQIILPESRDPRVYDVLFKSLKDHLIP